MQLLLLMQLLLALYETMSFRAARRRLVDMLLTRTTSCALRCGQSDHKRLAALLEMFPDARRLRDIAMLAFPTVISKQVLAEQRLQFLYSGPSVRLDGSFKKAKIIVRYLPGRRRGKRRVRPFTCLIAFCGTDGLTRGPFSGRIVA